MGNESELDAPLTVRAQHHSDGVAMEPRDINSPGSARDEGYQRSDSSAANRMRLALAAVANGKGSHRDLQHAAHELVMELKRAKYPPEQMLLHIKEVLAESGVRPTYASSTEFDGPPGDGATVYRDVIAWSIRSYYGDGDGSVEV
jgi:hypothetical protein